MRVRAEPTLVRRSRPARSAPGRARPGRLRRARATAAAISPLDVRDRLRHALAAVRLAAVAQLDRPRARRSRRRTATAARPTRAGLEAHVDLDGRIAARVEDLAGLDVGDSGSFGLLGEVEVVDPDRRARASAPRPSAAGGEAPRHPRRARRSASDARRSSSSGSASRLPRDVDAGEEQVAELGGAALRGSTAELRLQLGAARPRGRRARRRRPGTRTRPPPRAAAPCARAAARAALRDVVEHALAPLLLALDAVPALPCTAPRCDRSTSLRRRAGAAGRASSWIVARDLREISLACSRAGASAGSRPGRGGRRARRGASASSPAKRGVRDLVRLLDRVRHDRPRGLLRGPRDSRAAGARSAPGDRERLSAGCRATCRVSRGRLPTLRSPAARDRSAYEIFAVVLLLQPGRARSVRRRVALLLEQLLLDRLLHPARTACEWCGVAALVRVDDVPAVLGVHRL